MSELDILNSKILFLCTGNSCRSQIAEGLAKHYIKSSFIKSAGTHPDPINPIAIEVMSEINIDISNCKSKSISQQEIKNMDIIITLCGDAKEECIILQNSLNKHIHWDIKDPAKARGSKDELLSVFRETRDLLKEKILSFNLNHGK